MTSTHIDPKAMLAVQSSYGRCCLRQEFWDYFYDQFLASSPEIKPMFAKTDFTRQKEIIRQGLSFMMMFAKDDTSYARAKLESIGVTHNRAHYNVRPAMYPLWVNNLLKTLRHFDRDHFTPELERHWRAVLEPGIDLLKSKY